MSGGAGFLPLGPHQITHRHNGKQQAVPLAVLFQGVGLQRLCTLFSSQILKQLKGRNLGKWPSRSARTHPLDVGPAF